MEPIIGEGDCTIAAVVRTVKKDQCFGLFTSKWSDLASYADVSYEVTEIIRLNIIQERYTYDQALKRIIAEWIQKCKAKNIKPRLALFTKMLRKIGMTSAAETLENELDESEDEDEADGTNGIKMEMD